MKVCGVLSQINGRRFILHLLLGNGNLLMLLKQVRHQHILGMFISHHTQLVIVNPSRKHLSRAVVGCQSSISTKLLLVCVGFVTETLTHLPGQPVSAVAVDLPLTDGSDQQTLRPPQLLAVFDDVMPQLAGLWGAAQTLCVQLPEDLHAHLCRQRFCKVVMGGFTGGRQGGSVFTEQERRRGPGGVMLHNNSVRQFETAWWRNDWDLRFSGHRLYWKRQFRCTGWGLTFVFVWLMCVISFTLWSFSSFCVSQIKLNVTMSRNSSHSKIRSFSCWVCGGWTRTYFLH